MSFIFMATGDARMGFSKRDKDGNVTESTPARFEWKDGGACVAIGHLDPKTGEPVNELDSVFGDWDAGGYLARALELLKPSRPINIPDFAAITKAAMKDRVDLCDYCQRFDCRDCVVQEWKEDTDA